MSSHVTTHSSHTRPSGKLASVLITAVAAVLALGASSTVIASGAGGGSFAHKLLPGLRSALDDVSSQDTDGDWIIDRDEIMRYGTNPARPDSDRDGMEDGIEITMYGSNPLVTDTDGDGLSDGDELRLGTDILNADTDNDGLLDGEEIALDADPFGTDSDGDGLLDGAEVRQLGSSPVHLDSDGDGLLDADEVSAYGTNPAKPDAQLVFFSAPDGTKAQVPATAGASATTQTLRVAMTTQSPVVARLPLATAPAVPVDLALD